MSEFTLSVMTPEREFFSDAVEAFQINTGDGQITIYANHTAMVASVAVGEMRFKQNDVWREATHAQGFLEVRPDCTLVFVQSAEWPEEINEERAESAMHRAEERLKEQKSEKEYRRTLATLHRAITRLSMRRRHQ